MKWRTSSSENAALIYLSSSRLETRHAASHTSLHTFFQRKQPGFAFFCPLLPAQKSLGFWF